MAASFARVRANSECVGTGRRRNRGNDAEGYALERRQRGASDGPGGGSLRTTEGTGSDAD